MRSILVTGGAGFIGSNLVRLLLSEKRDRVINLDKLTYAGNLESLESVLDDPRHVFVEGDIGDVELVRRLLDEHRPAAIVNLAAESHVDRSIDGPAVFVETNVVGTFRLLESARQYWAGLAEPDRGRFRFLHVSTDEVFGSLPAGERSCETSPYAPNSPYSASKAAGDHFMRACHRTHGLPTLVTYSSNNYGPYQFPEKLIPLMIHCALAGRTLPVYGDGLHVRDWLYVEDHCRGLLAALQRGTPGEVYNLGAGTERANLELVQLLCRILDETCPQLPRRPCESLIAFVEDRPGHDRRYALDAGKARRELGWTPRQDLEAGLRNTVAWYLDHRQWIDRVMAGKYRGQRLGVPSGGGAGKMRSS